MVHQRTARGFQLKRRATSWFTGPGEFTSKAFSADYLVGALMNSATAVPGDGYTVVRIHGILEILLLLSTSGTDGFEGAFGMGIVSNEAHATGDVAIPSPLLDVGWEGWLVHRFFAIHASTATATQRMQIDIESKAKRRIDAGEILFAKIAVREEGVATMEAKLASRVLMMVP